MNNNTWAHSLIDQLIQQGVVDFCIAPGSRSTPLALAAARHPKARLKVHFDERGLGFYALGISMAKQKPCAVIITSGTAVGNLLPAVMEAHYSHIPMILLTADRPPELRDCGALQTADQIKIFNNFVLWQTDLPCPSESLNDGFIRSQASYAVFHAMRMGPVHLNCQFREPLFASSEPQQEGSCQPLFFPTLSIDSQTAEFCEDKIRKAKKGLILIGRLPVKYDLSPLLSLAHRLKWPIYADLLSQIRCQKKTEEILLNFDWAIQSKQAPAPDLILHFGGSFISKTLVEWTNQQQVPTIHIHPYPERIDPNHIRPIRILTDIASFCRSLDIHHETNRGWLNECKTVDAVIEQNFSTAFSTPHPFTEADMMRSLSEQIPKGWSSLFGNSMPIRNANHFYFPNQPNSIFCNRGLAGIDGQIATAAGIASALNQPVMAMMGDQSCLYDLNSIALLSQIKMPFLLVISNNHGGGIFSHLPVAQEPVHFESLFGAPHSWNFEKIAQMFGISYRCTASNEWGDIFNISAPFILEVNTSRNDNKRFHQMIIEHQKNWHVHQNL